MNVLNDGSAGTNNAISPDFYARRYRCADSDQRPRAEGSQDLIMVYGTSTKFEPAFEGRIASDVENAPLPAEWSGYINAT